LICCCDRDIDYTTIYRVVRYELLAKLKVPRPFHEKADAKRARAVRAREAHQAQEPGVIEVFKNYLPTLIKGIINEFKSKFHHSKPICYWLKRESRLGFRTFSGKKITLKGVKPKQLLQW